MKIGIVILENPSFTFDFMDQIQAAFCGDPHADEIPPKFEIRGKAHKEDMSMNWQLYHDLKPKRILIEIYALAEGGQ